jgi:hypothetical protein
MELMDRYRKESAAEKIEGYITGQRHPITDVFEKAKAEAVRSFEQRLSDIKGLSLESFLVQYPKYKG